MMTADSLPNVEAHYDSFYDKLERRDSKMSSHANKKFGPNMAYRIMANAKQLGPSSMYGRPFNDVEEMEVGRSLLLNEGPSFNGINRNILNNSFISNPLSLHNTSRAKFGIEQLSLESFKRSSLQHGGMPGLQDGNRHCDFSKSPDASQHASRLSSGDDMRLQSPPFDDDDDSWKICGVCNDKATGYHFNALTCEGCKGFFRRSIKNGKTFTCSYNNQCSITKNNRRQCQACRLQKCISIGMKKECIMSPDQIQQKKTLVLSNRIKRAALTWSPLEMTNDQKVLLDIICTAFKESNNPPDAKEIRGGDVVVNDADHTSSPCPSPASSNSSTSNFVDLIKRISNELVSQTPRNMTTMGNPDGNETTNAAHVLHFTDIMEYTIKEVIKFCKKIPTFMDLELQDQIALLKAGCTEIMFLKANYTYDIEKKALTLGPDILYTRDSFLQGGMSETYTDAYLKFHEDLGLLRLDDKEMAALSAIALFSTDRLDITEPQKVDAQQQVIAFALNAYTDSEYKQRNRFAHIVSFLPRLRTLNALCKEAMSQVQKKFGPDIKPLVIEVQPDDEDDA